VARGLIKKTIFLSLVMILMGLGEAMAIDLFDCAALTVPGATYNLKKPVVSTAGAGSCFSIQADDVTLDCEGNTITHANHATFNGGRARLTVKNCKTIESGLGTGTHGSIAMLGATGGNIIDNTIETISAGRGGIVLEGTTGYTVSGNQVTTASGGGAIFLFATSTGNTFSNNTVTTIGSPGFTFSSGSGGNTVTANTITTSGVPSDFTEGVLIRSSSTGNIITANTITTNGNSPAIHIHSSSSNSTVSNNTITNNGPSSSHGISIRSSSTGGIFSGNRITTSGFFSVGIRATTSSNGITFSANTINTSGASSSGFLISNSSNITINNANVVTTSGLNGRGVFLEQGSTNNLITGNSITTSGPSGYGVWFSSVSGNTLSSNTVTTSGDRAWSINSDAASNQILSNNIQNFSVVDSIGIRLVFGSNNNLVSGNTIQSSAVGGIGINIAGTTGNIIRDNPLIFGSAIGINFAGDCFDNTNTQVTGNTIETDPIGIGINNVCLAAGNVVSPNTYVGVAQEVVFVSLDTDEDGVNDDIDACAFSNEGAAVIDASSSASSVIGCTARQAKAKAVEDFKLLSPALTVPGSTIGSGEALDVLFLLVSAREGIVMDNFLYGTKPPKSVITDRKVSADVDFKFSKIFVKAESGGLTGEALVTCPAPCGQSEIATASKDAVLAFGLPNLSDAALILDLLEIREIKVIEGSEVFEYQHTVVEKLEEFKGKSIDGILISLLSSTLAEIEALQAGLVEDSRHLARVLLDNVDCSLLDEGSSAEKECLIGETFYTSGLSASLPGPERINFSKSAWLQGVKVLQELGITSPDNVAKKPPPP